MELLTERWLIPTVRWGVRMNKPYLGVWLDHTQAYGVWVDEEGEADVQHTKADAVQNEDVAARAATAHTGVYGALAPHAKPEDKRRQRAERLYDRIMRTMARAQKVYVFGPGLARKELQKRIAGDKNLADKLVGVASAEKMSEAQMVAHVKEFFELPRSHAG